MFPTFATVAAFALALPVLAAAAWAHGGQYRGPASVITTDYAGRLGGAGSTGGSMTAPRSVPPVTAGAGRVASPTAGGRMAAAGTTVSAAYTLGVDASQWQLLARWAQT